MHNDISHIIDGIYMSGFVSALPGPEHVAGDFDAILSLTSSTNLSFNPDCEYMNLHFKDEESLPDTKILAKAIGFIRDHDNSDEKVLVHCQAGINRSALVVSLFLLYQGFESDDAIELVRSNRFDTIGIVALQNETFESFVGSLDALRLVESIA